MIDGIAKQYLRACLKALCTARSRLLELSCDKAALEAAPYGKTDSLSLDAVPEVAISRALCREFDPSLILVTEEVGSSAKLKGKEDELVCICDPMDRSELLSSFLKQHRGNLAQLFSEKKIISEWENHCGDDVELTGPFGSLTAIRHRSILFCVMINYITGTLYIAAEGLVGSLPFQSLFSDQRRQRYKRTGELFSAASPLIFDSNDFQRGANKFVCWCQGKEYEDNLVASGVRGNNLERIQKEDLVDGRVGGPARVLYLQHPRKVGFILSNGEKVVEWLGWLAFVKFSNENLAAFELSFESSWTRDGILMAPSAAYSILGGGVNEVAGQRYKNFTLDLQRLGYLPNPSQYRSTIVVCPIGNVRLLNEMAVRGANELVFGNSK